MIARGTVDEIRSNLKQNMFEMIYKGNTDANTLSGIELIESSKDEQGTRVLFKYMEGTEPDIQVFGGHHLKISLYREVIPSMQEVFIQLTDSKNA